MYCHLPNIISEGQFCSWEPSREPADSGGPMWPIPGGPLVNPTCCCFNMVAHVLCKKPGIQPGCSQLPQLPRWGSYSKSNSRDVYFACKLFSYTCGCQLVD